MTGPLLRRVGRIVTAAGTLGAIAATTHTAWNLRKLRKPVDDPPVVTPRVSVLLPARNEVATIGQCLASLRAQAGVPVIEILVLDDHSTDGTDQVIAHHLVDPRVHRVTSPGEPPSGWLGKTWACHALSEHATGSVLVFVDADVELATHGVAATVSLLDGFDAVCPYPQQVCSTTAERLVQPLLQWSWLTFLPLRAAERSTQPSLAAANGQLLAITRDAYDAVGGHAAVRGEVLEDLALFRTLKRNNRRVLIADGTSVARCHMYEGWRDLRDGYTKSLWAGFGSPAGAIAAAAGLGLLYVVPAAAMLRGSRAGAVGYLAAVAGRALVARRVGGRGWPDSAAHPVSVTLFSYLVARSLLAARNGTLTWKGRSLPAS